MTANNLLPVKPLLRLLHLDNADSVTEVSRLAGIDRSGFHRTLRDGRIGYIAADQIAIRLGLHPILIWGDEWLDAVAYRMGRIDTAFELLRGETGR
jgi:hypothetical protein